jgi:hypothetical protein
LDFKFEKNFPIFLFEEKRNNNKRKKKESGEQQGGHEPELITKFNEVGLN